MELQKFKLASLLFISSGLMFPQNVVTGGYSNSRTNANLAETQLAAANVTPTTFKQLFSLAVDGQIYAQPLFLQNVNVQGQGLHNVVYAATMHNTVYAFDADTPGTPLWSVNLGPAVPTAKYGTPDEPYTDINLENGILSTPVIDTSTGTMYVVAATLWNGNYYYRLHALSTSSGEEKFYGPTTIKAQVTGLGDGSVLGSVAFDASQHLQRPALLLSNGTVYIAFGSHGDAVPFHGWMMGYNASDLRVPPSVMNTTPNGSGGSFWQSGRGPAADPAGNVFAVSSNGTTDSNGSYSSNVLRLDPQSLAVKDWFSPFNFQALNDSDVDLGSCGAVLLDGTNYLITGGKQGVFYLMDKTNLGHFSAGDSNILQSVDTGFFGIFNIAVWNKSDGPVLYIHTANSGIKAYKMVNGRFPQTPTFQSMTWFSVPFQGMSISANGSTSGTGILWMLAPSKYPLPAHAVLHAYSAETLSEVWNSDMVAAGALGTFSKFANPTVANGKVYVPTAANLLAVYGQINVAPKAPTPVITSITNGASHSIGPLSPGEIIEIAGDQLGPQNQVRSNPDTNGALPTEFYSTQVTFNGIVAPILATSNSTVSTIVPFEVAGADSVAIQVTYDTQTSAPVTIPMANAAPGVFSADESGTGPALVTNCDGSPNTPDNPAKRGERITVYATGGGLANAWLPTGTVVNVPNSLAWSTSVIVGGEPVRVRYAGHAVGKVAGTIQLTLDLPSDLSGDLQIVVIVDGQASPATATVSVQ